MDLKTGKWPDAPSFRNVSCSHPRYTSFLQNIGFFDTVQALLILLLTLGILAANLLVIIVINHRRYTSYIQQKPRYLLTSLALNDLAIGLLITPFGVLPALFHCWPYGEIYCQIQALLRGALSQQSAVILICMAVDRYICAMQPHKYQEHNSRVGCFAFLSVTWTVCLVVFGVLVLPRGYYFNGTGLLVCEPFYSKPSYRILATCFLYFPTTMILMYCYGSSFHASSFRTAATPPANTPSSTSEKVLAIERRLSGSASRTMAAMSLGFIVMATPWTIQEVVAACTGSKVPPFLDFLVTWTAISNSFWNPFLYWLLNAHFRRISRDLLSSRCCGSDMSACDTKSGCCSVSSDYADHQMMTHPSSTVNCPSPQTRPALTDLSDSQSEKYWGVILERTVSSNNLHALQRIYGQSPSRQPNGQTSQNNQQQPSTQQQLPLHHHHHHYHNNLGGSNSDVNGSTTCHMTTSNGIIGSTHQLSSSPCCCASSKVTPTCQNCAPRSTTETTDIDRSDTSPESGHPVSTVFSNTISRNSENFYHERHCAMNQQAYFINETRHGIKGLPDL